MLALGGFLAVPLFHLGEVVPQYFYFFIFIREFILHLEFKFFLVLVQLVLGSVSLFSDPGLLLLFFTFIEVFERLETFLRSFLDLLEISIVNHLPLLQLFFKAFGLLL